MTINLRHHFCFEASEGEMLQTASLNLLDEVVKTEPEFWTMNRLHVGLSNLDTIYTHKRIEYTGVLIATGGSALVRICIVQPKTGGEAKFANRANAESVFGTISPTVASAVLGDWRTLSDRHYMVTEREELDYSHRLSHNMSLHESTLGGDSFIKIGPIFWCAIADTPNAVTTHNIVLRTVGVVDTVENF